MSAHCDKCDADLCYGDNGNMFCEVCQQEDKIEELQTQAAVMREALEQVEWVPLGDLDDCRCPWCFAYSYGHEQDCKRQAALSSSAGREMLEKQHKLVV